jgi:hypothetical protein
MSRNASKNESPSPVFSELFAGTFLSVGIAAPLHGALQGGRGGPVQSGFSVRRPGRAFSSFYTVVIPAAVHAGKTPGKISRSGKRSLADGALPVLARHKDGDLHRLLASVELDGDPNERFRPARIRAVAEISALTFIAIGAAPPITRENWALSFPFSFESLVDEAPNCFRARRPVVLIGNPFVELLHLIGLYADADQLPLPRRRGARFFPCHPCYHRLTFHGNCVITNKSGVQGASQALSAIRPQEYRHECHRPYPSGSALPAALAPDLTRAADACNTCHIMRNDVTGRSIVIAIAGHSRPHTMRERNEPVYGAWGRRPLLVTLIRRCDAARLRFLGCGQAARIILISLYGLGELI